MSIKYYKALDVEQLVYDIIKQLNFQYIHPKFVYCYRSVGSKSQHIIARIYGLGKIWQKALQLTPRYIIEVISERYDKLHNDAKEKVLIHELLHIPYKFSGGFHYHKNYVTKKRIERLHKQYKNSKLASYLDPI